MGTDRRPGAGQVIPGLVSTVIPVHDRPRLLLEAVESVLGQTYRPIEVIVVDDGSTDDTGAVADSLVAGHPGAVRVIHQENTGVGLAREAGRLAARGEYLQYLDSDDLLLPRKFELQVKGFVEHPECGVAYGRTRRYPLGGPKNDRACRRSGEELGSILPAFLAGRGWSTPTPLYRREVTDRAGAWTNLRQEEDWEYDCRVGSLGVRLWRCEEFVAEVRSHEGARLCSVWETDDRAMLDRARAHELILGHARRAGIGPEVPEMQHFARRLFLLARQCGARGLSDASERLFLLSRDAAGPRVGRRLQYRLYRGLVGAIGWAAAGRVAALVDRVRLATGLCR